MVTYIIRKALTELDEWLLPGRRYLVVGGDDVAEARRVAAELGGLTVAVSTSMPPDHVSIVDDAGLDAIRKQSAVVVQSELFQTVPLPSPPWRSCRDGQSRIPAGDL